MLEYRRQGLVWLIRYGAEFHSAAVTLPAGYWLATLLRYTYVIDCRHSADDTLLSLMPNISY